MEVTRKRDYLIILYEYCIHLWNRAKFYTQYTPKFLRYLMNHKDSLWRRFLNDYIESLKIEVYALRNKKLNKKHGDFKPEGSIWGYSGINKALEIDTRTASRILRLGKDENELFKREVKDRTEPYSHLAKRPDCEKIIAERQEELEGQGLGEIIAIKEEKPEKLKPTEEQVSDIVGGTRDERREG